MSIYSTEATVEEGDYVAFLQSVGGLYLSHIHISEKGTNQNIRINENDISDFLRLCDILQERKAFGLIKRTFVCNTSDGSYVYKLMATENKVVLYDDDGSILYFDLDTFTNFINKIYDALWKYNSDRLKEIQSRGD